MTGGIKVLLATAALATAGCAETGELNIRAVADPLTKAVKPGNPMIDEARGLLALGNVGLAIEAYRKVLRSQPGNIEALAGLAECYDRMGRHDLSRMKYEAALAVAPRNPILLRTFAASLERQGRMAEGKALRAEADQDESAAAVASVGLAPGVTAPTREVAIVAATPVAAAPAVPTPATAVSTPPARIAAAPAPAVSTPPARIAPTPAPAAPVLPIRIAQQANGPAAVAPSIGSITVKLPPASAPKAEAAPVRQGPRLERLSLVEVELVTSDQPRWKTELVHRTALSTTVRFVPLAPAPRFAGVRLLNAARHQGLAARTRLVLNRKGWDGVRIGDADRVRQRSLVLYSPATAGVAKRLAAEFGFGIAKDPRPGPLTVLLGRDAIGRARSAS
ncbi:MAG TPA: LytR C-terminal domain-containing protein [Sphingomicrobium sp.]